MAGASGFDLLCERRGRGLRCLFAAEDDLPLLSALPAAGALAAVGVLVPALAAAGLDFLENNFFNKMIYRYGQCSTFSIHSGS